MVLEDALSSDNPYEYYEGNFDEFAPVIEEVLFPGWEVTLGERDLIPIFQYFDKDNSQRVTRRELKDRFLQNKGSAVTPYLKELADTMKKLRLNSYQPSTAKTDQFEIYYGSRDQLKSYNQAVKFCKHWGGDLLKIDSIEEYKMLLYDPEQLYW
jgi:hypothetical protein